ncbi:MAG: hypothetical protein CME62_08150 [Halobacteriovoraceae bacterium]|nr:hypothetical protein [Halobacteriovoraceae bacterium]|tara:strand:- start:4296 stop:5612 length:1317 start_codon:yes stop_codon:yes gene_type:complete
MNEQILEIVIFFFGILVSAFFSGSEAALISIPIKRVKHMVENNTKSSVLPFLASHQSELLTTLLIGNNFVNIFVASYATTIAQRYFENDALSYSVGITTFLILIFGEIIPKTFMRNHAERLVIPTVFILRALYYILYPVVFIFMFIIKTVLGENAALQERMITKDDIEFMVGEAEKEKTIDSKQIDLLTSILEFPTIKVKDIMTPRTSVHAIKADAVFDEIGALIKDVQHSRYPVFTEDLDSVIGLLHVKDIIFASFAERENFDVTKYINEPFYVYEHMKIQAVFDHMNKKKVHLALVKDENGLMVGIVTLEDIMEEIFGEIQDEHDDEEDIIQKDDSADLEKGIVVPGAISLRDLDSEYDIHIPLNDNYSTLRGFLLDMLGNNFPKKGDVLFWDGLSFELLQVEDEIEEVKIESTGDIEIEEDEEEKPTLKEDLAIN